MKKSKDAFYFSHDYNARNDRKLARVRRRFKMEGIGVYWCIIEMMYEEGGSLPLSEIPYISEEFRTKEQVINQLVHDFDLFENDGQSFWSKSVKDRLDKRLQASEIARAKAMQRWSNAAASDEQCTDDAIKERKEKERREKERKEIEKMASVMQSMPFNSDSFLQAWGEWVEFRREKKQALKSTSIKKQFDLLSKYDEQTAIAILNQSIQNGYQGLFPLKTQQQGKSTYTPPKFEKPQWIIDFENGGGA